MNSASVFCWVWEGILTPTNKPLPLPDNNLLRNGMILLIFFFLSFPAHVSSCLIGLGWVGGQQTHLRELVERL